MCNEADNLWGDKILLTSVWQWQPKYWGCINFTGDRGKTRRDNLFQEEFPGRDRFIAVCYVTMSSPEAEDNMKGMIAGYYVIGKEKGNRNLFTHEKFHNRNPEKWTYALGAKSAFTYSDAPHITELCPDIGRYARAIGAVGRPITNPEKIQWLRDIPGNKAKVFQPSR